jgi:hypothetical protein
MYYIESATLHNDFANPIKLLNTLTVMHTDHRETKLKSPWSIFLTLESWRKQYFWHLLLYFFYFRDLNIFLILICIKAKFFFKNFMTEFPILLPAALPHPRLPTRRRLRRATILAPAQDLTSMAPQAAATASAWGGGVARSPNAES